jgi:hypothetical protein
MSSAGSPRRLPSPLRPGQSRPSAALGAGFASGNSHARPPFVAPGAALRAVPRPARQWTRERADVRRSRADLRRSRSRHVAIAAMSALCITAALAGCGDSSSTRHKVATSSPDATVLAAARAMGSLRSVHGSAAQIQQGVPVSIDMDLVTDSGATGQMSVAGRAFRFIAIGQTLYINGSLAFWSHATGSTTAAQRLQGKWLKTSLGSAQFAALTSLTNLREIVSSVVDGHGLLIAGPRTTINGLSAMTIHDATRGGTMYIATVGRPYMLELSNAQDGLGHVTFEHFDAPVSLTPPANTINATQ